MPDENRKRARELWEQSGGTMPLKDIAQQLGLSDNTVRQWKRRDGWSGTCHVTDDASRKRKARANVRIAREIEQVEQLSDIEKEFCLYYVQSYNAARAAWKTGHYTNLNSAKQGGWHMLQKSAIQDEIQRLKQIKRASILATTDDLVELHMRIAFADMGDYVVWAYDLDRRTNRMAVAPSDTVDTQLVGEVSETKNGFKIKLRDRKESMAFLERFFQANPMDGHKVEYDNKRLEMERSKNANKEQLDRERFEHDKSIDSKRYW